MSLRINHNIAALNGHRNMVKNDKAISTSLEKLSSGLRINRAADDAAGLVISEQMRAQVVGLNQAISNSETAVSMVQTAEGAFDEMNSLLSKARQLAIHAANTGVNDSNALSADQSELDNIINSITRIAENTQFGNKKLLDGTLSNASVSDAGGLNGTGFISDINIGTLDTDVIALGLADMTSTTDGVAAEDATVLSGMTSGMSAQTTFSVFFNIIGVAGVTTYTAVTAADTLTSASTFQEGVTITISGTSVSVSIDQGTTVATALSLLNVAAAAEDAGVTYAVGDNGEIEATATDAGTYSNDYQLVITGASGILAMATTMETGATTAVDAAVTITDADGTDFNMTLDTANRGRSFHSDDATVNITATFEEGMADTVGAFEISLGAVFQIGANRDQTVNLSIDASRATDLAHGAVDGNGDDLENYVSLDDLRSASWLTTGRSQDAISAIDKAIDEITVTRGQLGALQANTLESGLNGLRVSQENLNAAESTIRDVDFAAESSNFTRSSILIQSATAMLAQANQLPQNVLALLQ